jgi:hypothetical protein
MRYYSEGCGDRLKYQWGCVYKFIKVLNRESGKGLLQEVQA